MEETEGDLQKNLVSLLAAHGQIYISNLNIKQMHNGPKIKNTTRVSISDVAYISEQEGSRRERK